MEITTNDDEDDAEIFVDESHYFQVIKTHKVSDMMVVLIFRHILHGKRAILITVIAHVLASK